MNAPIASVDQVATTPAVITYSNCPVPNGLLTAQASGALARHGITLEVLTGQQGATHFSYDHQAYTRFGGEIPPLVSEGLRAPGRTRLLGLSILKPRQGFYVARQSVLHTAADLKGKKVGASAAAIRILTNELGDYRTLDPWQQTLIALGTWEARALLHTLEAGGLSVRDVSLVRIDNPWVDVPAARRDSAASLRGADLFLRVAENQGALLDQGYVDALFTWLPWAAELEEFAGARPLLDLNADRRNHYASAWTISSDLVERAPEVVQRLVDAVVESTYWAIDHGEQVTKIHAENLGVSTAAVRAGFGDTFYQHLLPTLDTGALAVVKQTHDFLLQQRLIDHSVDFSLWAAPEFLANSIERFQSSRRAS